MSGLLMAGLVVPVPGHTVINRDDARWAHLDPGDGNPRSRKPTQIVLHKTIADDPEVVLLSSGPSGGAERTAEFWQDDPQHSGAHIVIGEDGVIACLADLVFWEAYHATVANHYSIGIEMREQPGGRVYIATLQACVAVVGVICEHLAIPLQHPDRYNGHPLARLVKGGPDFYGIYGHRHNTERRGRWDPGDLIFKMLRDELGSEAFDLDSFSDLKAWRRRQDYLNSVHGEHLVIDGLAGMGTLSAMHRHGYASGMAIDVAAGA
jgi:hypothetical protein